MSRRVAQGYRSAVNSGWQMATTYTSI